MSSARSITHWLASLQAGNPAAAQPLRWTSGSPKTQLLWDQEITP
jgi:hypothetical protein